MAADLRLRRAWIGGDGVFDLRRLSGRAALHVENRLRRRAGLGIMNFDLHEPMQAVISDALRTAHAIFVDSIGRDGSKEGRAGDIGRILRCNKRARPIQIEF